MNNEINIVENLLRDQVESGTFADMAAAEYAVRAWLQHRNTDSRSVAASLKGDMTEDGDADYQDQAMRSVDA